MKLLITGATGLVGSEIVRICAQKQLFVHYLTTSKEKLEKTDTTQGFYWNPMNQEIDANCLNGVDTIINLAGASISKRWTNAYKKEILESRILSVQLLYKTLSENKHQVKNVVSASAIGIYPSSFSEMYNETSKVASNSFLGSVVSAWETEVDTFTNLGLSVCKLRIGIVLSKKGGALEKMTQPIRLRFGAALGSGNQWQSWIHIDDIARLFLYAAENNLSGVYNAVASEVVTNKALTKAIANILKKPLWLPKVPSFVLKLVLGEMASLVLESQHVENTKILETGFVFEHDVLKEALKDCLL
jgi:uncharacterized protein (TIGR01777 family)